MLCLIIKYMVRQPRQLSRSGVYHVILRGINQQRIFEEDSDYQAFLNCMDSVMKKSGCGFYAYCLMGNHVHLLLRVGEEPLSLLMKRLALKYAVWFNTKYDRSGHLFQNRYKSYPVEEDAYCLAVLCYIYQNPVASKISKTPISYKWGSRRLLGNGNGLIDEEGLLKIASIEAITGLDSNPGEELEALSQRGRKSLFIDEAVYKMMRDYCGISSASASQAQGHDVQKGCVIAMRNNNVSIRQIARVTGLSKGVVERWRYNC